MDKNELNKIIATYIVAIGPSGAPNSHVWMAIDPNMSNLDNHQAILGALISAGLVKEQFHFLTLTEKGQAMFRKLAELYKFTPEPVKEAPGHIPPLPSPYDEMSQEEKDKAHASQVHRMMDEGV